MKKGTYYIAFILNLIYAYIFLFILAIVFYVYNRDNLGVIATAEYGDLIKGFLKFSTANICYTFGLYAISAFFPYRQNFFDTKTYKLICTLLYTIGIILVTISNLADTIYFHYSGKRFTAGEIFFLDNSNNLTIIRAAFKDNLLLMVIGVIIIFIWLKLFLRTINFPHIKFKNNKVHYIIHSTVFALIIFIIVIGMRGGINRQTRPITISNAAQYTASPEKGSLILSNPFCILRTIENKPSIKIGYSDITPISTTCNFSGKELTVPSQKGKNVIIFILESFSAEHSKKLYPDLYNTTLTPFLDSLMGEGYLLRKSYANGRKSIDALPSILSSIPSFDTPFATIPEALAPTDALGNILKENDGYSTWFFNGSERSSMGYVAYSKIAGINNFRTKEDYEAKHGTDDFDGYWGIWDEPFFKYMAEELDSVKTPFLSVIFSLTSHHPFIVPENYKNKLPKGYTKVHQPVAYVDLSLRHFFDYAKKQSWYNNTLFVFVADHVSSEKYGSYAKTTAGGTHILNFYYTPDGSLKGETNSTTQQIDIMPSIVSLLGINRPVHCFGKSVFINHPDYYAINYSGGDFQWISQDTSYIFNGENIISVFDLNQDPLQQNNIVTSVLAKDIEYSIKSFLKAYYSEIKTSSFKAE